MAGKLKITLRRSLSGQIEPHRRIVKALGLRRIRHSVVRSDSPQIRGMVESIRHLVTVEKE